MPPKSHLVLHHSGTEDGSALSVPAIRQYHLDKGWADVGYHFLIELFDRPDDSAPGQYLMVAGRPLLARAAGEPQQGMNKKGIHICCVGNFDEGPPPDGLLRFLFPHLADLMDVFDIPLENVIGHREIGTVGNYKRCPGRLWNMPGFRQQLGGQA